MDLNGKADDAEFLPENGFLCCFESDDQRKGKATEESGQCDLVCAVSQNYGLKVC